MRNDKDFKFDNLASSYDEGFAGKQSKIFYELLLSQLKVEEGATVLDVGCGTGTILKRINETAGICGYGIDSEEKMIAVAKQKCPDMDIQVADCAKTPFGNEQFDIITACMAYHHFSDKKGFAKEAARIIKPGGRLYIADPRFPFILRKLLNFSLQVFKTAGFFGSAKEIGDFFTQYGFTVVNVSVYKYALCITLEKV